MNKEYVIGAILLGVILAICITHGIQSQWHLTAKWAFSLVVSFVGFCMALARIIGGRR